MSFPNWEKEAKTDLFRKLFGLLELISEAVITINYQLASVQRMGGVMMRINTYQ